MSADLPWGNSLLYPLGTCQRRSGRFGQDRNLLSLPTSGPCFVSRPTRSLVAIPTELTWFSNYGRHITFFGNSLAYNTDCKQRYVSLRSATAICWFSCNNTLNDAEKKTYETQSLRFPVNLTLILRRSRTGTVWFYTSTSNKREARPKLCTKSLTRDLKLMYIRFTLVRISINF